MTAWWPMSLTMVTPLEAFPVTKGVKQGCVLARHCWAWCSQLCWLTPLERASLASTSSSGRMGSCSTLRDCSQRLSLCWRLRPQRQWRAGDASRDGQLFCSLQQLLSQFKATFDTFFVSTHQQNKNEKKQKRDQAKAQALASKKQSDEILKSLENIIKVSNQLH